ncbi:hypothetical protein [Paraconexibacter algicola]|uniref:Glycosyltransferase RgtA/B/C/D-like domain-containing protein n=1 Tax=Paraconexibacter algicola TaxID=2133960 RepID=A0A2T4UKD7_9ACTN|nr:hypothetical protein [Paraconexibacter algicola]PTL59690.1 hypothetical protein C7Y72_08520 [Paraconexibacter algicola]
MALRSRRGALALVALGLGWALVMQSLGWAQTSYYAFVKALGAGTTKIDAYHWETRDKSYIDGHFYSVKAPGLPLLLTPVSEVLDAAGGRTVAADAAKRAKEGGAAQWSYRALNVHAYGYDRANAIATKSRLERQAPLVWALGLVGTVIPALLLLVLVRRRVERVEPGLGALTAVTLGGATLIMPFAVNLFGHVLATLLAFAAFALAWHERDRPTPRLVLLALAGLLSGLAVTTEYPLAIAGAIVGLYAMLRPDAITAGPRALAARAGTYATGVILGVVPLFVYNLVAFGSITTLSYKNAVNEQGTTGHETLGLNDGGFFGIGVPAPRQALDLLISPRGVLVLIPIVVMACVGTWLLYRRGRRAEASVIGAIAAAYYLYDTGYWLPMGGGSPGPRFLIPMLPFLAVGLACAWRRYPGPTLALAVPSAVTMVVATITMPLIGPGGTATWMDRLEIANFQHTFLSVLGLDNGWAAIAPVLLLFAAAAVLAARSAPRLALLRGQARPAALTLLAWGVLAGLVAPAYGEEEISGAIVGPTGKVIHTAHQSLVVAAVLVAALVLLVTIRRSADAVDDEVPTDAALETQARERTRTPRLPWRPREPIGVQHHRPDPETA